MSSTNVGRISICASNWISTQCSNSRVNIHKITLNLIRPFTGWCSAVWRSNVFRFLYDYIYRKCSWLKRYDFRRNIVSQVCTQGGWWWCLRRTHNTANGKFPLYFRCRHNVFIMHNIAKSAMKKNGIVFSWSDAENYENNVIFRFTFFEP